MEQRSRKLLEVHIVTEIFEQTGVEFLEVVDGYAA